MRYKLIAAGVGLVGYGALLGWAITGDKLEAKMKSNQRLLGDIIQSKTRELESAKGYILNQSIAFDKEAVVKVVSEEEPATIENDKTDYNGYSGPVTDDPDAHFRGETVEETRTNLQKLIDQYNPDDVEAFTHMASQTVADSGPDNTPPFVISSGIYAWDEEGEDHAKNTLTYYSKDRVLLDDDKDVIDHTDVDGLVGWKNLDRFGDDSGDANVVFIRNRRLLTDFEVVRDDENPLPAHIRYGLDRHEFETHQAAGLTRFRRDDV